MGVYNRGKKLWISFTYNEIQCREPLDLDVTSRNHEEAEIILNRECS